MAESIFGLKHFLGWCLRAPCSPLGHGLWAPNNVLWSKGEDAYSFDFLLLNFQLAGLRASEQKVFSVSP